MQKKFIACFAVILAIFLTDAVSADIISPWSIRPHEKRFVDAAKFTLLPAKDKALTLELSVNAEVPGICSYSLAVLSGDAYEIIDSAKHKCTEGIHTYNFTFPSPETGRTLRYVLNAEFMPESRIRIYFPVKFRKNVTVSNVNGTNYVAVKNKK